MMQVSFNGWHDMADIALGYGLILSSGDPCRWPRTILGVVFGRHYMWNALLAGNPLHQGFSRAWQVIGNANAIRILQDRKAGPVVVFCCVNVAVSGLTFSVAAEWVLLKTALYNLPVL